MTHKLVTTEMIETYQRDGVVVVPGLFADHVETLRKGVERNMTEPGPYASENKKDGESGRFFDDYCNWQRIPEFEHVIRNSPAAEVAADLMGATRVQMFHDHVLVKEPGTSLATPWHTDGPYYFVEGKQTVSFWSPLDPVKDATLRMVAGSHRWEKPVLPMRWVRGMVEVQAIQARRQQLADTVQYLEIHRIHISDYGRRQGFVNPRMNIQRPRPHQSAQRCFLPL